MHNVEIYRKCSNLAINDPTGIQVCREADLVKIWVLKCENASKAVQSGTVVEEVGY